MSTINSTYQSDVVLGFKQIPLKNFSRKIYFIEKNRDVVENMDADLRIELLDKYSQALYEIGHFRKCLTHVEPLIFDVINEHYEKQEEDLFCILLKRKACALYHLGEFEKSQYVSSELLKINPDSIETNNIMTNAGYRLIKERTRSVRAFAVMMLIFGITFTCFDLLIIQNFYPEQEVKIGWVRGITIGGAMIVIASLELYAFLNGRRLANTVQKESLVKKGLV